MRNWALIGLSFIICHLLFSPAVAQSVAGLFPLEGSGRVIYNANVNAEVEQTIDLSGVPAGAYFVRVTNDSFSKVEKLIIK